MPLLRVRKATRHGPEAYKLDAPRTDKEEKAWPEVIGANNSLQEGGEEGKKGGKRPREVAADLQ